MVEATPESTVDPLEFVLIGQALEAVARRKGGVGDRLVEEVARAWFAVVGASREAASRG